MNISNKNERTVKIGVLLIPLMVTLSCGQATQKPAVQHEDSIPRITLADNSAEKDEASIHEAEQIQKNEMDSIPIFMATYDSVAYRSIKQIDAELHGILCADSTVARWMEYEVEYNELLLDRLKFHLSNPLTFRNDLPQTGSRIKILQTPDKKYKLYSYSLAGLATGGGYENFIQFQDESGGVHYLAWQPTRSDYSKFYLNIYQFNYKRQNYYVLISYNRGSSRNWGYYMEIATIKKGKPTFYTQFFPEGKFKPGTMPLFLINEEGDSDQVDVPTYDVCICSTDFGRDLNVRYDPATKSVSYNDYGDYDTGYHEDNQPKRVTWSLVFDHEL